MVVLFVVLADWEQEVHFKSKSKGRTETWISPRRNQMIANSISWRVSHTGSYYSHWLKSVYKKLFDSSFLRFLMFLVCVSEIYADFLFSGAQSNLFITRFFFLRLSGTYSVIFRFFHSIQAVFLGICLYFDILTEKIFWFCTSLLVFKRAIRRLPIHFRFKTQGENSNFFNGVCLFMHFTCGPWLTLKNLTCCAPVLIFSRPIYR